MENSVSRNFKKVTGERIVAAIIDSIIVGIVSAIPTVVIMFKDGFQDFLDSYMNSVVGGTTPDIASTGNLIITGVFGLIIGWLYFAYIPYKWNGQTLAKKLMSIKAIDEFGNNPTLGKHTIRAIQIWDVYVSTLLLPVLFAGTVAYSVTIAVLGTGVSLLVFVSFVLLLAKDDGRGLHDSMAGTYVVKADIDLDKQFVEKATQMGEWAEVDYDLDKSENKKTKDDWYE